MDSIIAKANDGFDKDGNFLNGQTELLPWPKGELTGTRYDLISRDPASSGITGNQNALPNIYEKGGYFTASGSLINKYDENGSLVWTISAASMLSSAYKISYSLAMFFYDDGNKKWLLGIAGSSQYNSAYAIKINIDGSEWFVTSKLSQVHSPFYTHKWNMAHLEDGSFIIYSASVNSYMIDTKSIIDLDSFTITSTTNGEYPPTNTAYCFNGSVSLYGFSANDTKVLASIGLDSDLDFNELSYQKASLKTHHVDALSAIYGDFYQIEKDTFISYSRELESSPSQPRLYSRNVIEKWLSNCVYATTGIRIPLKNEA